MIVHIYMLKEQIGKIEDIKVLKTTDKYTLSAVIIGGLSLSTFDKGIAEHFKIGKEVICEYEDDGKYKTIKTIRVYNEEGEKKYKEYINSEKQIGSTEITLGDKRYKLMFEEI